MPEAQLMDLAAEVARFERWHYQFDLGGLRTPIFDPDHVQRHAERRAYFFDPLLRLSGGSLRGKRVLDLGCNAGWWSLQAIEAGCDRVVGIDGRPAHIGQAELVFRAKGVDPDRYRFLQGNFLQADLAAHGPFDIVLALGIFYHVSKPIELLERIREVNTDLLVVDTALSRARGAFLEMVREPTDEPRNAVDRGLVLWPTLAGLLEILKEFGYGVRCLEPRFKDWRGSEDYRRGLRRAVIASRRTDLAPLAIMGEECSPSAGLLPPTDLSSERFRDLLRALLRKGLRAVLPRIRASASSRTRGASPRR
jgi:tRNA (mo5U34)-methyltransferase